MTNNETTTSNRSIARRTMIGIVGSGMATLAGCFGGSDPDNSESDDSAGGSTETPTAPEERSQYIESTEIVVVDEGTVTPELALEVTVVDSYDWYAIELLTENRENYSRGTFDTGEIQTRVPLTDSLEHSEPVPPGEHTLLLDASDLEAEVPFTLSTQMEFVEAVPDSDRDELDEGSVGLVFRNTGTHADTAARVVEKEKEPDELDYSPIPPEETGMAEVDYIIGDTPYKCQNEGVHDQEITVEFLWSEALTVSVPIESDPSSSGPCDRSLAGTATVVNGEEASE